MCVYSRCSLQQIQNKKKIIPKGRWGITQNSIIHVHVDAIEGTYNGAVDAVSLLKLRCILKMNYYYLHVFRAQVSIFSPFQFIHRVQTTRTSKSNFYPLLVIVNGRWMQLKCAYALPLCLYVFVQCRRDILEIYWASF